VTELTLQPDGIDQGALLDLAEEFRA
jgi:hypothetical protein